MALVYQECWPLQGEAATDRQFLVALLDAADMAYGAYKVNPQSLCAVSKLKVRSWHAQQHRVLCPALPLKELLD